MIDAAVQVHRSLLPRSYSTVDNQSEAEHHHYEGDAVIVPELDLHQVVERNPSRDADCERGCYREPRFLLLFLKLYDSEINTRECRPRAYKDKRHHDVVPERVGEDAEVAVEQCEDSEAEAQSKHCLHCVYSLSMRDISAGRRAY